jgi:hypothetical protein
MKESFLFNNEGVTEGKVVGETVEGATDGYLENREGLEDGISEEVRASEGLVEGLLEAKVWVSVPPASTEALVVGVFVLTDANAGTAVLSALPAKSNGEVDGTSEGVSEGDASCRNPVWGSTIDAESEMLLS